MPNRADNVATSTEVIPAGHAALTAEEELGEHRSDTSTGLAGLSVAALGVVFGDIGTSPVYTFRECFNPEHGLPLDAGHVLGILSMIFWVLIIVVAVKYVLLIMRADNQGEGGILALLALAQEAARGERSGTLLVLLALGGAALFFGDSMITPAISVLSAVEGIGIATPALHHFILPLTVAVLLALFLFQKGGTERVGRLFGPVMVLWFAVIAIIGGFQITSAPRCACGIEPRARSRHLCRCSGRRLRRAWGCRARHHRRRGALRRYGPFWPLPDQAGVVRRGASRSRPQLFRTRRPDPRGQGGNREPVLPHGAGLGLVPAGAAVDRGDGHRLAGGDLRRVLAVAAGDPARPDAAARYLPDLDP